MTRRYYIIIERIPGDRKSREYFDYNCDNDTQAREYAENKRKMYEPGAEIVDVRII